MAIATGIGKSLYYKKESALNTAPGITGAQDLRRVTSDLNLQKQTYQSQEIRSDYQIADFRHGARSVGGTINGELSCLTWTDFMAAAFRKAWAAGGTTTSSGVTASSSAPHFTRATGSWITDGFKVGDVVRVTGFTSAAANNNRNYRITALTALNMTVADMNATTATVAAEAAGGAITVSVVGKKLWVPSTGHTDDSFYIEHWHRDINQSERFGGCKVAQMSLNLPATGMATIATSFIGVDMATDTSSYFTLPTSPTTTGVLAAVNGRLRIGGTDIATVTGLSLNINGNMSNGQVIGSNVTPDIFEGRFIASGQFAAYFEDGVLRDNFLNEDEISLHAYLTATNAVNSPIMAITLPRIKLGTAPVNDGEGGLIRTYDFQALKNVSGGASADSLDTTVSIQDSEVP